MSKFVLTAELQFRSPVNLKKVQSEIRSGLSNIDVDVKIRNSAQAKREVDALRKSTDRAADSAENLGKVVAVSFKRFATYSAATRVVSLFTSGLASAVGEAISFEREMVKVAQVSGKTTKQLSGLSDEISRLATTWGVSSASLIGVTRVLTQAGFQADETKVALEALAKSELAPTFDNITQTAEGAVAIFNQFEEGAGALESQLGSINAVAGRFAVESGDLIAAVRRVGGVFKASGGSLEKLLALFTSIRSTTRESGESIATGLRTIFVRIQRPRTLKFLDEMGVKLTDMEGKFVGPFKAVKRMNEEFAKFEQRDPRFIKVAEEIAGFRQIGKVIPLLQQFQVAQEALSVAQKGQNSLTEDAEKAQESLAVRIVKLKEEFLLFVREVYNSPIFQLMANSTLHFASSLLTVVSALKDLIPLIGVLASIKLAKTLGIFLGSVGKNLVTPRRFNTGGPVPGVGNKDTQPAMLTPGEFVINKTAARRIGYSQLAAMNSGSSQNFQDGVQYLNQGGYVGIKPRDKKVGIVTLDASRPGNTRIVNKDVAFNDKDKQYLGSDIVVRSGSKFEVISPDASKMKKGDLHKVLTENITDGLKKMTLSTSKDIVEQFSKNPVLTFKSLPKNTAAVFAEKKGQDIIQNVRGHMFEAVVSSITGAERNAVGSNFDFDLRNTKSNLAVEKFSTLFNDNRIKNLDLAEFKPDQGYINDLIPKSAGYAAKELAKTKGVSAKPFDVQGLDGKKLSKKDLNLRKEGEKFFEPLEKANVNKEVAKAIGDSHPLRSYGLTDTQISSLLGLGSENIDATTGNPLKVTGRIASRPARQRELDDIFDQIKRDISSGVLNFNTGGFVPGAGNKDTVPAMLTPGEFVINKKAAKKLGYGQLEQMNDGKMSYFAFGGRVGKNARRESFSRDGQALGSFNLIEQEIQGLISEIETYNITLAKSLEKVQVGRIDENKLYKTNAGDRHGSQLRGLSTGSSVLFNSKQATGQTARHEIAHEADRDLTGGKGFASEKAGSFQYKVAEELKKRMIAEGKTDAYRLQNKELFADVIAKTTPEARKILLSTTDAAKGSAELVKLFNDAKAPIQGLADLSADEFGGKQQKGKRNAPTNPNNPNNPKPNQSRSNRRQQHDDFNDQLDESVAGMKGFAGQMFAIGGSMTLLSSVLGSIAEPGTDLAKQLDLLQSIVFRVGGTLAIYKKIVDSIKDKQNELNRNKRVNAIGKTRDRLEQDRDIENQVLTQHKTIGNAKTKIEETLEARRNSKKEIAGRSRTIDKANNARSQALLERQQVEANDKILGSARPQYEQEKAAVREATREKREALKRRRIAKKRGDRSGVKRADRQAAFHQSNIDQSSVFVNAYEDAKRENEQKRSKADSDISRADSKISHEKAKIDEAKKAKAEYEKIIKEQVEIVRRAEEAKQDAIRDTHGVQAEAAGDADVVASPTPRSRPGTAPRKKSLQRRIANSIDIEGKNYVEEEDPFIQFSNKVKSLDSSIQAKFDKTFQVIDNTAKKAKDSVKGFGSSLASGSKRSAGKLKELGSNIASGAKRVKSRGVVGNLKDAGNKYLDFSDNVFDRGSNLVAKIKQRVSSVFSRSSNTSADTSESFEADFDPASYSGSNSTRGRRRRLRNQARGEARGRGRRQARIERRNNPQGIFQRTGSAFGKLSQRIGGLSGAIGIAGGAFIAITQIVSSFGEHLRKQYEELAAKNLEDGDYDTFRSNSSKALSAGRVSSTSNAIGAGALTGAAAGAAVGSIIPGAGTVIGGAVGGTIGAVAGGIYAVSGGRDFDGQKEIETKIIEDALKKSSEALKDFDKSIIDSATLVNKLNKSRQERLKAEANKSTLNLSEKIAKINEKSLGEEIVGHAKTFFTTTLPGFIIRMIADASFRNAVVEVFKGVGKGVYNVFRDVADSLIFTLTGYETARAQGKRVAREKEVNEVLRFKDEDRESIRGRAAQERGTLLSEIQAINDQNGTSIDERQANINSLVSSFADKAVKVEREALIKEFLGKDSQGGKTITAQEGRRIDEATGFLATEFKKVAEQGLALAKSLELQRELALQVIKIQNDALKINSAVNIATNDFRNAIKGSTQGISTFESNLTKIELSKDNIGFSKQANKALDDNIQSVIKSFNIQDAGVVNTLNSQKEFLQSVNRINDNLGFGLSDINFKKYDDPAEQQGDIVSQIQELTGDSRYGQDLAKDIEQRLASKVGVRNEVDSLTLNKVVEEAKKAQQKSVDIQSQSIKLISQLHQEKDKYILQGLKDQIQLEEKLTQSRLKGFDVIREADKIIEQYGGPEARKDSEFSLIKQNILNRNVGLGNINNAGQIKGGISAALAQVQADKSALANGVADNDPKKFLELQNSIQQTTKALNSYIPTIKELIKGKEEELDIIAKKNKYEKDSLESLIKGDIQSFFKKQSAIGATAAIASGDERLTNLYGATAIGGALDNLNAQKDAGVTSLFGANIEKLIEQAGVVGLHQKKGLDLFQAQAGAQVIAGSTAREEQIKGQIRGLAGNLKDAGFAEFKSARMDVANATIVVNRNVKILEDSFSDQIKKLGVGPTPSASTPTGSTSRADTEARAKAADISTPDSKVDSPTAANPNVANPQASFSDSDVKNLQLFTSSVKELSAAVEKLAASKIQVQVAPVNVNLNVTGSNILDFVKQEVRSSVGEEVSRAIRELKNSPF